MASSMNEQNTAGFLDKISITKLTRKFAVELGKDNYFQGTTVLNRASSDRILQTFRLAPDRTKLVAYHAEEKRPIGFLCVEKNSPSFYSIKFVFVDSKFRNMGVATKLLHSAMLLAKKKGAKKVNINVYPSSTEAISLYKKLGFGEIGCIYVASGFSTDFLRLRGRQRFFVTLKRLLKLAPKTQLQPSRFVAASIINKETLFGMYQKYIDPRWTDFFEIEAKNLINGSRHGWEPPYLKDGLVSDEGGSFVLIFNRPFSSSAAVELYCSSDALSPSMLENLLQILARRAMTYVQITMFNQINTVTLDWFKGKGMSTCQYIVLGKEL